MTSRGQGAHGVTSSAFGGQRSRVREGAMSPDTRVATPLVSSTCGLTTSRGPTVPGVACIFRVRSCDPFFFARTRPRIPFFPSPFSRVLRFSISSRFSRLFDTRVGRRLRVNFRSPPSPRPHPTQERTREKPPMTSRLTRVVTTKVSSFFIDFIDFIFFLSLYRFSRFVVFIGFVVVLSTLSFFCRSY